MRYLIGIMILLYGNLSTIAQSYNTATGTNALYSVTTGGANTATGTAALNELTTGWNNSAHGTYSLLQVKTGNSNSAYGASSQYNNYNGNENVSLGYRSLRSNYGGGQNTACGVDASYFAASNNGTSLGWRALYYTYNGASNVGIGSAAGLSNYTGYNNTYIGYSADNSSTSSSETAYTNTTLIGAFTRKALNDTSNKITVGTGIGSIGGSAPWTNWSDRRIKESIKENVPGLIFINALKPVTYKINMEVYLSMFRKPFGSDEAIDTSKDRKSLIEADLAYGKITHTGFIAQDVFSAANNIGYQFSGVLKPGNENGLYSLSYEQFVVPLVKSAQELSNGNGELLAKLQKINNRFQQLCSQISEMKQKIGL